MRYFLLMTVLLTALPAGAYVGPGPGLTMLGSALGMVLAIMFALLVVIAYPIRMLILKMRGHKKDKE